MTADIAGLFGDDPATAAVLAAQIAPPQETDGPMIIPASLAPLIRLFAAVATQWRVAGMAGEPIGLDLVAVDVAARWLGLTPSPDLLDGIAVMEAAALTAIRERGP